MKEKITAFIGAGNMAEALARGILKTGVRSSKQLLASDPIGQRRDYFSNELGIEAVESNREVVLKADEIILAIKPQMLDSGLSGIDPSLWRGKLVISIMAGISTSYLEKMLEEAGVVRVMPNTPALVGEGVSVMSPGSRVGKKELEVVRELFSPVGKVLELPEKNMNSITALSGSGPAYVFAFTEALIASGVAEGISKEIASLLAVQTVVGAACLLKESGKSPRELRQQVTSPGGTTEAALRYLESERFHDLIKGAVEAARQRGQELGGG